MDKIIRNNKFFLFTSITLLILKSLATIYFAFIIGDIVNSTVLKDMELFKYKLNVFLIILVSYILINYLSSICLNIYSKKVMYTYKNNFINKLLSKNIRDVRERQTSFYINSMTREIDSIEDQYVRQVPYIVQLIIYFMASAIAIFFLNIYIAVIVITLTIIAMIIPIIFGGQISRANKKFANSNEKHITKIKEIFSGFDIIKLFNLNKRINKNYQDINQDLEKTKYKFRKKIAINSTMSEVVGYLIFISSIIVGSYLTIKGDLNVGQLFIAIQLMNGIVSPIGGIVNKLGSVFGTKTIREKHRNILKDRETNSIELKELDSFNNNIVIKNLTFKYQEKNILEDFSLKINKNDKVIITGKSGSGKSTLMKLILGYFEEYDGEILIDDMELKNINLNSYSEIASIVSQDVFIFNDTIKNNILLGRDVEEEKYKETMKMLKLDHLIERKELIDEDSRILSGGEKQRLSIARNLILGNQIIFLDEATSSLDNDNVIEIMNILLSLKNITVIMISHNHNSELLKQFDQVVEIK